MDNPNSFLEPLSANEPKSRAKSCTECRQVKLKCDYREKAPEPCTRCAKRGLDCKKDASFKRVPSRARKQQQQATVSISRASSTAPSPNRASLTPDDVPRRASSQSLQTMPSNIVGDQVKFLRLQSFSASDVFTLGDVAIQASSVVALFRHYEDHLYEHMPVLEPCYSLNQLYSESQLLFWTLVAVSARLHPEWTDFYDGLAMRYETMLYKQLFAGPPSIKRIHAMLLLCLWPFPVPSQEADGTYTLCGAAINTALQLGIHRNNNKQEYLEGLTNRAESDRSIRDMTWLACVRVSTSMSLFLNLPPPITAPSLLRNISELSVSPSLSPCFRASSTITSRTARLLTAFDSAVDSSRTRTLLEVFEHDLTQTRAAFSAYWTPELEIELLFTNLYVQGASFVPDLNAPDDTLQRAHSILHRGLLLAVSLINSISRGLTPDNPLTTPSILPPPPRTSILYDVERTRFYPKPFFRHIAFAAYFLLFYISTPLPHPREPVMSSMQNAGKDIASAQASLGYAVAFLSAMPNPEAVRIGRSIAVKAKYALQTRGTTPVQNMSLMSQSIVGSFEKLGTYLREASGQQGTYELPPDMSLHQSQTDASTPSTTLSSPESFHMRPPPATMGPMTLAIDTSRGWMDQGYPQQIPTNVNAEIGQDMGQVYQGMETWGLDDNIQWDTLEFGNGISGGNLGINQPGVREHGQHGHL